MHKKPLGVVAVLMFFVITIAAQIPDGGASGNGYGWAWSEEAAVEEAEGDACRTCYKHQRSCGAKLHQRTEEGWFSWEAWVTMSCDR